MSLVDSLKVVLATSFAFRMKAQYYHWNIEGPDFQQYHTLFGGIYTEVDAAVDVIAEQIRTLDAYAPGSFKRLSGLSQIDGDDTIPAAKEMLSRLASDNTKIIAVLMKAREDAESLKKIGIVNFLEGRIDIHEKHGWMLRASSK